MYSPEIGHACQLIGVVIDRLDLNRNCVDVDSVDTVRRVESELTKVFCENCEGCRAVVILIRHKLQAVKDLVEYCYITNQCDD